MWLLLLLACSSPPDAPRPPAALSATWSDIVPAVDDLDVLIDRDDSLLVRGPADQLTVEGWSTALVAAGWTPQATSSEPDRHAVRYVRGEGDDAEALVFAATRYEGLATHSLTRVPPVEAP